MDSTHGDYSDILTYTSIKENQKSQRNQMVLSEVTIFLVFPNKTKNKDISNYGGQGFDPKIPKKPKGIIRK